MNNRTEAKLTDLSGMHKAIDEILIQAWERGRKYGRNEERTKGEWIIHPHSMIMRCSLCGNEETAKDVGTVNADKHFCPNCGADMRGCKE